MRSQVLFFFDLKHSHQETADLYCGSLSHFNYQQLNDSFRLSQSCLLTSKSSATGQQFFYPPRKGREGKGKKNKRSEIVCSAMTMTREASKFLKTPIRTYQSRSTRGFGSDPEKFVLCWQSNRLISIGKKLRNCRENERKRRKRKTRMLTLLAWCHEPRIWVCSSYGPVYEYGISLNQLSLTDDRSAQSCKKKAHLHVHLFFIPTVAKFSYFFFI